jgi:membrane protein
MTRRQELGRRLAHLVEWADTHPVAGSALRIVRELLSVDVRDRIFGMTGQAFLAMVPLLIIISTAVSEGDGETIAGVVNDRLALSGPTADTVTALFTNPNPSDSAASVVSVVLLLFSLNSFTRTMRRSVERPWGLPKSGVRGQVAGLLGVVLLVAMFFTLVQVGGTWTEGSLALTGLDLLVRTVVATGFWLAITYVMSTARLPLRHLWPGAVAGGVAQTAAGWWTVVFLPTIMEKDASRYGVIGVALGILTWLVVMSGIAVGVGVVGAQVARSAGWVTTPAPPLDQPLMRLLAPRGPSGATPRSTATEEAPADPSGP